MNGPRTNVTLGDLQQMIEDLVVQHGEEVLDRKVFSSSDYGDRCHTTQLNRFDCLDLFIPEESGYSVTGWRIDEEAEQVGLDEEDAVVVLVDVARW